MTAETEVAELRKKISEVCHQQPILSVISASLDIIQGAISMIDNQDVKIALAISLRRQAEFIEEGLNITRH